VLHQASRLPHPGSERYLSADCQQVTLSTDGSALSADWLRASRRRSRRMAAPIRVRLRTDQREPVLQLCADLANGSKHLVLTKPRTGDLSTTIARNDVAVFVGTGTSAHRFYVASAGKEYDALQLAEDAVAEWTRFLSADDSSSSLWGTRIDKILSL
jgi:hypothetical protein